MKIINGLGNGERVETLLELEELVELTSDGFRPARIATVSAIAARLRVDQGEGRPCGEVPCDVAVAHPVRRRQHELRTLPLSQSDDLFLRSLHIAAHENDGEQ